MIQKKSIRKLIIYNEVNINSHKSCKGNTVISVYPT